MSTPAPSMVQLLSPHDKPVWEHEVKGLNEIASKTMKEAITENALPRIHSKQVKNSIHESFTVNANGILHTLVPLHHIDAGRAINISFQKPVLLFSSCFSLKAFFLGVLKGLKESAHSAFLAIFLRDERRYCALLIAAIAK